MCLYAYANKPKKRIKGDEKPSRGISLSYFSIFGGLVGVSLHLFFDSPPKPPETTSLAIEISAQTPLTMSSTLFSFLYVGNSGCPHASRHRALDEANG